MAVPVANGRIGPAIVEIATVDMGGGATGVIIAVAISHWTRLARIIRAEILQLKQAEFVMVSRRLGRSPWWIARKHMLPHIVPQFTIGLTVITQTGAACLDRLA